MTPETIGIILGSGVVVINVSGFWYREWRKHKTWKANGKDLTVIKREVKSVGGKMNRANKDITIIKTKQDEQTRMCESTVKRFDTAITSQQEQLVEIAKDK